MPTLRQYLTALLNQRNALADNLTEQDVPSTHDEKLNTLVPKVLEIEGGGTEGHHYSGTGIPSSSKGEDGDSYVQTIGSNILTSDGVSSIDTGIYMRPDYSIETVFAVTVATSNWDTVFGTRNGSNARYTARFSNSTTGALALQKSVSASSSYSSYTSSFTKTNLLNEYQTVRLDDGCLWYENDVLKSAMGIPSSTATFPYTLYLFSLNDKGSIADYGYLSMAYFIIYDENKDPLRFFIPSRDDNGIAGMLDLVSGSVFGNQGSGAFTFTEDGAPQTYKKVWIKEDGQWRIRV